MAKQQVTQVEEVTAPVEEVTAPVEELKTALEMQDEVTVEEKVAVPKTANKQRSKPAPKPEVVASDEQTDRIFHLQPAETESSQLTVGVYKLNEYTKDPEYGTEHSACFDIRVNLKGVFEEGGKIKVFDDRNQSYERTMRTDENGIYVEVRPHERIIAPTGAIFDIPVGYSLKVHPRSGTSLKQGINLINQEAVIDADYVNELFILLVNTSGAHVKIYHDERYAQGEIQKVTKTTFETLANKPELKSDRVGGLGHTGVK